MKDRQTIVTMDGQYIVVPDEVLMWDPVLWAYQKCLVWSSYVLNLRLLKLAFALRLLNFARVQVVQFSAEIKYPYPCFQQCLCYHFLNIRLCVKSVMRISKYTIWNRACCLSLLRPLLLVSFPLSCNLLAAEVSLIAFHVSLLILFPF